MKDQLEPGLPLSLLPFFQEYDFTQFDPDQHADLVLERVLAYGNREELRWLFQRYGRTRIVEWVIRLGARRLPWRRHNLWCVLLNLPPTQRVRPKTRQIWPH
jgi:hypothetical protein